MSSESHEPTLWILHDQEDSTPQRVNKLEARTLNRTGWGVFHCYNIYYGERRIRSQLAQIKAWYVDLDTDSKREQLRRLETGPLYPSLIIESANGYHAYWYASDATREEWARVVRWGLVPYYSADPKASDPLRLLRAPGYLHNKRAEEPFEVRIVSETGYEYTQAQMLEAYPDRQPKYDEYEGDAGKDSKWHVDARIALPLLSGHPIMNYESFELRRTGTGNYNIVRQHDNYSTGCWVDQDGLIGGCNHGVTLYAWLSWYGHPVNDIKRTIRKLREQLGEESEEAAATQTPAPADG